ncbi:host cell division inhibitor Icd-like protein [Hafnia paralvei]|uniref:host cell division inhibitor Icd-like protein n=1 Tax=Hafnia paralvei TaxID=546367 RepID=UPI00187D23FE|nr:host cell division inhibitor Icd-like protein [Hafnia paralvei]
MIIKGLKCDSLSSSFKNKGAIHLESATPRSAGTHAGRLTKPLIEVTIMACFKSTQTHPKFQYRFLALNRHDKKAKPCRLSVEASTEHEARRILAPHFILSFAARLPATIEKTSTVQEVHHA